MGVGIDTANRNRTRVTRLKLASVAIAGLVTATFLPPPPASRAIATVEHGAIQAYEALQVVYTVATTKDVSTR